MPSGTVFFSGHGQKKPLLPGKEIFLLQGKIFGTVEALSGSDNAILSAEDAQEVQAKSYR